MFDLLEISEWITYEYDDWKIKIDAPEYAKEIFYNFLSVYKRNRAEGAIVE